MDHLLANAVICTLTSTKLRPDLANMNDDVTNDKSLKFQNKNLFQSLRHIVGILNVLIRLLEPKENMIRTMGSVHKTTKNLRVIMLKK